MFSEKSTTLVSYLRRYNIAKKKCLFIKYIHDTRYTKNNSLITHDLVEYKTEYALAVEDLSCVDISNFDAVFIDELQFFKNAHLIKIWLEKVDVFASGLNGDYLMRPFENISLCIPWANEIKKMHAICMYCYKDADFTYRTVKTEGTVLIGGLNEYKCVCRECYNINNK